MRTDNVVRFEAMDALITILGVTDAERFINLVKRDALDYCEWQQGLRNEKNNNRTPAYAMGNKIQQRKS